MSDQLPSPASSNSFEHIRRTNPAGHEYWSSRDFALLLGYADYRNFQSVIESARTACFNSGQRVDDHFVEVTDMIGIGKGGQRQVKTVMMSRYACYLVIQNADPAKAIVAQGQTYFAVQTRRQELSDQEIEKQRRLTIRSELRMHNSQLADAAKGEVHCHYVPNQRSCPPWKPVSPSSRKRKSAKLSTKTNGGSSSPTSSPC